MSKRAGRTRRHTGIGVTFAIMLGLGIGFLWAGVLLIPSAQRLGMAPGTADKLPYLGFLIGAALGFAITVSRNARAALSYLTAPLLVGVVTWFFSVLLGSILVGFGLPLEYADYVPVAGFALGVCLGAVPSLVKAIAALQTFASKHRQSS